MKFNFTSTTGSDAGLSHLGVVGCRGLVLFTDLRIINCYGSLFCNSDGGLLFIWIWADVGDLVLNLEIQRPTNTIDNVKAKIQDKEPTRPAA